MIIIIMMILIKRPSQSTEKHISDPIELGSMLHAGGYLSPKVSGKWLFSMSLQVYNWFICFCSDNLQKIFAKWGYHSELQSSGENPTQSWSLKLNSILVMGLYIWFIPIDFHIFQRGSNHQPDMVSLSLTQGETKSQEILDHWTILWNGMLGSDEWLWFRSRNGISVTVW